MKIIFKKLGFPKGLNLGLLRSLLTEEKLRKLIALSAKKSRVRRRIVLPSDACLRKVIAHYIWKQILAGKTTWPKLKKDLKKTRSLKALRLGKSEKRSISISEMGVSVEGSSQCPLRPHRGLLTLRPSPPLYKQCITVLGMLPLALQSGHARERSALNSLNPWIKSS